MEAQKILIKKLLNASRDGKLATVKRLVESGANINCINSDRETPLIKASQRCHLDVIRYLLDSGADPKVASSIGNTALLQLLSSPESVGKDESLINEVASEMIRRGADVNGMNYSDMSAVFFTVMAGRMKLLKTLVDNDADLNIESEDGMTPLMHLVEMSPSSDAWLGRLGEFMDLGADMHYKNCDNKSAYEIAREKNDPAVFDFFNAYEERKRLEAAINASDDQSTKHGLGF